MFDIGFAELLFVAVLALVVLGPERLPGAVRTVVYWVGKVRKRLQSAKEELERELDVDGVRQQLHNDEVLRELDRTRVQVTGSLKKPSEQSSNQAAAGEDDTEKP